jgi:hypothetical protein
MSPLTTKHAYSYADAARTLSVSKNTIPVMVKRGDLEEIRYQTGTGEESGERKFVTGRSIDAFIERESQKVKAEKARAEATAERIVARKQKTA